MARTMGSKRLKAYLAKHGISQSAFARRIGVSNATTVRRYLKGEHMPEPNIMRRIEKETDGAVIPSDFYRDAEDDEAA